MKVLPAAGPDRWRQMALLGVTSVVLLSILWYQLRPAAQPVPASTLPAQQLPPLQALTLPQSVRLDVLTPAPERSEVGRNPFGFGVKAAPPPPPVSLPPPVVAAPAPVSMP